MKTSIRKQFVWGIVFFLVIILFLSVLSAFYLNKLSSKAGAILKENHYSVVYARDMAENLMKINQEVSNSFIANRNPDSLLINKQSSLFGKSIQLEKNNITEVGEDELAGNIQGKFNDYLHTVKKSLNSPASAYQVTIMQQQFDDLFQLLMALSQMNEKAIEVKTIETKVVAKKFSVQMSIAASICFLISFAFTFSFGSYVSERFFQLYKGVNELASSHYKQRLYFEGTKDEFHEISLVVNEMAEKLSGSSPKKSLSFDELTLENNPDVTNVQELKRILVNIKTIEEQTVDLISKLETTK